MVGFRYALPFVFRDQAVEGVDDLFDGLEVGAVDGQDIVIGFGGFADVKRGVEGGGVGVGDGDGAGNYVGAAGRRDFVEGDQDMTEKGDYAGAGLDQHGG